ncbi:thiol reductant ABC exporter subunit CydD [Nocardioides sp.]|uniref:thiol reductant ABC exporter subunit CydD n=1 Tax=Nocardioides sp. TaxID=35761 RepID=UPI001A2BAD46|nr:thiol reductant ABC exporter subunit CydD [Nocardioides sp.]MBJ7359364.1 thiol reductant ABC exporter subunit CydD [Nocardioides sp.]
MRPSDPWLLRQLRPARDALLAVVGYGVVSCVLVIAQAWAVTALVIAVLDDRALTVPAALVGLVLLGRAVAGWLSERAAADAAATVASSLRGQLVDRVVARAAGGDAGTVSVLLTRGVTAIEPYVTRYLPALVLATFLPGLTVVVIATQDLLSAVIVALTLPLVPVFGALVGLATRDRARSQWREMSSLSGHFLDVVRGLPTLVAFRRARPQSGRIAEISDRYRRATLDTLRIAFASSLVLELVATLSVALVAVTTGVRLAGGSLDLHTAMVVLLLAPEAYWPLRRVGAEFHAAAEGTATFESVRDLLAESEADAGMDAGMDAGAEAGAPTIDAAPRPGAALVLRGVTLTHPGRARPAVVDLDGVIPARGLTVVTGPSGCGKSTLLDALAGLMPLGGGYLGADGLPVGGPAWRAQVAWLPQRPHFVAGSVADNLRLGSPDASDQQLWEALAQVALEERVRALPDGLDTPLGEDGTTLSAGERARLALARIVVADRPWMLLDEPTAHLDELTERVITDTLLALSRRGAVVVVAHRPALVAAADHVLALPAQVSATAPTVPVADPTGSSAPPAADASPETDLDGQPEAAPRLGFRLATLLGGLASASGVALTATAGWLIVQASTHPAVLTMLVAIVGVRTFGLARPVLRYAERLRSHDAALRLLAERRVRVYDALVPLTPGRLGRRRGDVLSSVVDDVDCVVDRELRVLMPVRGYAVAAVLATAVATYLLPAAGLVLAVGCLVSSLAFVVARLGARRSERLAVESRAALSATAVEVVQTARELRMWQAAPQAAARVVALSDLLGRSTRLSARSTATARALVLSVAGLAMVTIAHQAAGPVADGRLSGPMMALLVLLPLALAEPAAALADAGTLSVRTDAAAARLARWEHLAPAVRDTVPGSAPTSHELVVDRAQAQWDQREAPTQELSLSLAQGERVVLVGPSGSGKSTLAALAMRFLDPVRGQVTHGGRPLRDLALDDVRRVTGLVDDDPHVFATTLVENVRLARPGASDLDVAQALVEARLGPWVASLPDGLDTWIGDGHAGVSGGERARIAVARSLLADQPVLVLDEPAAHLDHATTTELAAEVLSGPRRRSVLWITHADVGLDLADRVVRLADPYEPLDRAAGAVPVTG